MTIIVMSVLVFSCSTLSECDCLLEVLVKILLIMALSLALQKFVPRLQSLLLLFMIFPLSFSPFSEMLASAHAIVLKACSIASL